jgi:hypothetical protein
MNFESILNVLIGGGVIAGLWSLRAQVAGLVVAVKGIGETIADHEQRLRRLEDSDG